METKSSPDAEGARLARPRRRYPWWAWALIAVLSPVAFWGPEKLLITTSASLPYRIWLRGAVPEAGALKIGSYLAYRRTHPWTDDAQPTLMVKSIGCLPGQAIRMDRGSFYCGANWLGEALREDSQGQALEPTNFQGVIPAGHFFMVGEHPRAWDSKYYGLIRYEEFEIHVTPLF